MQHVFRQRALLFFACWIIAAIFLVIDPFEIDERSRAYSRDMYNLVIGTGFPTGWGLPAASERDSTGLNEGDVTVVLVDEQSLRRLALEPERVWPATASFYAMALEAILAYEPKVVVVDVLLLEELPGSFEPLERTVQHYENSRVSLLFVGEGDQNDVETVPTVPLPAEFAEKLADRPRTWPVTKRLWTLARDLDMVEIVAAPVLVDDGVIRTYPVLGELSRIGPQKTAAVRAYELGTKKVVAPCGGSIELFWDFTVPGINRRWMNCSEERTWLISRLLTAILDPDELRETCATTQTVPLVELLKPRRDHDAELLIKGKLIVFGVDIIGGDTYATVISRHTPGVFIHAMALKNLLAFNDRYLRDPQAGLRVGATEFEKNYLFLLLSEAPFVALVALLYSLFIGNYLRESRRLWGVVVDDVVLGVVTSVAAVGVSTVLMKQLSIAPLNWLGLGGLAVLATEVFRQLRKLKIPKRVKHSGR
ncbi:MAG: CHASE2 domain-containing protein [Rhodospirillales bacterium]|nr:CHASE2 domain-containing protein [Rhodospirillales bacterium]